MRSLKISKAFKIAVYTEDVNAISDKEKSQFKGHDIIMAVPEGSGESCFRNVLTNERYVLDYSTGYGSVDDAATYYYYSWEKG